MNGCLAQADSNMFIPSTLGGPVHSAKGIDMDQLKINLNLAADVYMSKVNGAPCGESTISLEKGCAHDPVLGRQNELLVFLSEKKQAPEKLGKSMRICSSILTKFSGCQQGMPDPTCLETMY